MKIRETFENRKKNGQKALVTYIVSGDYGYETTKENIRAMVKDRSRCDRDRYSILRSDR
mgnify:FL=1